MKIPYIHKDFLGREVRVRWGNPKDPDWNPKEYLGMVDPDTREITLNPSIRGDAVMRLGTLIHEHLHIIDNEMQRLSTKERFQEWGSQTVAKWTLPHAAYNRVAYTLARWLLENGCEFNLDENE